MKQGKRKVKHMKQDNNKKKVRKTPVLTHFQRKEIKTQKEKLGWMTGKIYLKNF